MSVKNFARVTSEYGYTLFSINRGYTYSVNGN